MIPRRTLLDRILDALRSTVLIIICPPIARWHSPKDGEA